MASALHKEIFVQSAMLNTVISLFCPSFLVYCFFQLWPLINTFILSFKGNGKKIDEFIGLGNFEALLFGTGNMGRTASAIHETFFQTLGNTFIVWIGNFIPQIIISLFACRLVY